MPGPDVDYLYEDEQSGQLAIGPDGKSFRVSQNQPQGASLSGQVPRYGIGSGNLPGGLPWAAKALSETNDANPSGGHVPDPASGHAAAPSGTKIDHSVRGKAFKTPDGQYLGDSEGYFYRRGYRKGPDGIARKVAEDMDPEIAWKQRIQAQALEENRWKSMSPEQLMAMARQMEDQFLAQQNDLSTAVDPTLIRDGKASEGPPEWLNRYMDNNPPLDQLPTRQYGIEQDAIRQLVADR